MTELSFAESFLTILDSKPVRIQADYAVNLKTYEPTGPYTLPRMPRSMQKPKDANSNSNSPRTISLINVTFRSNKNPKLDMKHPTELLTSVLELKKKLAAEIGLGTVDKIRLLYRKKPCQDSKTIKDIIAAAAQEGDSVPEEIEFTVMVIGGVPKKAEEGKIMEDAPVSIGPSGKTVLGTEEFWSDLRGFLEQRVKDASVAGEVTEMFKQSWENRS